MNIQCARIAQNVASTIAGRKKVIQTVNAAIKIRVYYLHHKHSPCASSAGKCHLRGKVVGLCYDHFGDFESFIADNQYDGLRRRIRSGERSVVDVVDKAWERRDCVEVFTKEGEYEQLESIILGGPV